MADGSHTSVNLPGQASDIAKTLPKLQIVDDRGFPLIPREQLPFQKFRRGYIDNRWHVEVPDDPYDAELAGQMMALAFLRMAPAGRGDRQGDMQWMAGDILAAQVEAIREGGNARRMVDAFWGTVARFAEPAATSQSVERWRGVCIQHAERQKEFAAVCEAAAAKEHSERARHAANARWAKHRKSATRGKAVKS